MREPHAYPARGAHAAAGGCDDTAANTCAAGHCDGRSRNALAVTNAYTFAGTRRHGVAECEAAHRGGAHQ